VLNLYIQTSDWSVAGAGKVPRSGDFIAFRVLGSTGPGLYRIRLGAGEMTVRSSGGLEPGRLYRGRLQINDGRIRILVSPGVSRPGEAGTLQPGGIAGRSPELFRAFVASGLPLDPPLLQKAARALSGRKEDPDFLARLAGLLLKKGLSPDPDFLDGLIPRVWPREQDGSGGERRREEERSRERKDRPEKDSRAVLSDLKRQWQAVPETNPLHLFNHLSRGEDHWILLPYGSSRGGETIGGWLAIKLRRRDGMPVTAALKCRTGRGDWDMVFTGLDGRTARRCRFRIPGEDSSGEGAVLRAEFIEKLGNLGFESDDNKEDGEVFDGFSWSGLPDLQRFERLV